jgi:hypothetical protein
MSATLMTDATETPPVMHIDTWHRPEPIWQVMRQASNLLQAGVKVVLVRDPLMRMVGVFRFDEMPFRVEMGGVVTLPNILCAFAVPASKFFD